MRMMMGLVEVVVVVVCEGYVNVVDCVLDGYDHVHYAYVHSFDVMVVDAVHYHYSHEVHVHYVYYVVEAFFVFDFDAVELYVDSYYAVNDVDYVDCVAEGLDDAVEYVMAICLVGVVVVVVVADAV